MGTTMSLKGKKVLITCGPTWVPIDDMRVISNLSTGRLGQQLARDLSKKKANVTLLEGQVEKPLDTKTLRILKFTFFKDLQKLLKEQLNKKWDIVIHAAAVSDYHLKQTHRKKIDSGKKKLTINLEPTPKLLNLIKRKNAKATLVGFKLESSTNKETLRKRGRKLIDEAQCDFVVANSLKDGYQGYILDRETQIIAKANSRTSIVKKLIASLEKQI